MYIFFTIPLLPIICLVLGLLGVVWAASSFILMCVLIFIEIILWSMYAAYQVQEKEVPLPYVYVQLIFGMVSAIYRAYAFTNRVISLKAFWITYIFMAIICLICHQMMGSKSHQNFQGFLLIMSAIVLSTLWAIGYEIGYTVKVDYRNIAYFECISDTETSFYKIGDKLTPHPQNNVPGSKNTKFLHEDNYEILLPDGSGASVPSKHFNVYYWADSEYAISYRAALLRRRLYGFFPSTIIDFSEFLFDHFHPFIDYKLVPV